MSEAEQEIPIVDRIECPECGNSKNLSGRGPRHDTVMGEYMIWSCHNCDCEFRVFEAFPEMNSMAAMRANRRHAITRKWGRRR